MREALALYGRALAEAESTSGRGVPEPATWPAEAGPRTIAPSLVRFEDGAVVPFPVERYVGPADGLDQQLLAGVRGPVLDVGCGPGRHLRALSDAGVPALGIDLSPVAVAIARRDGARAMVADIFGDVPGAGSWRTALLLDGNIGIGGDPLRLLRRLKELVRPEGLILVELDPPGSPASPARARIELAGERSGWFEWGRLAACQAAAAAAEAGMSLEREWSCGERWFAPAPNRPRLSLPNGERAERAAEWGARLAVLAALAPIVAYVWIAAHRLGYPYELDWLEGGAVELVGRVLHGNSLYTAPTLAYVSYTYPPLYTWVSAAVAEVTGLGFLPLRLVSFASSLVAITALWRWTIAATRDRAAGVVAAGLFAATYGLTGWWFDVGRLDSLFVALALVTLWLGRHAYGIRAGAAVGVLAFLAFFTKQSALVAVLPALVWLTLIRPRAGLAALAALIALVGASTLLLDGLTGSWYRYYVLSELTGQPWQPRMWVGFWRIDLYDHLRPLAWLLATALAAGAAVAGYRWTRTGQSVRELITAAIRLPRPSSPLGVGYELSAALGLLPAAWFSRLHTGGYLNVLMPAYAGCALLGGVAFARLRRLGPLPALVAVALMLLQLAQLMALPDHARPPATERAAGAALIAKLRSLPGPVLVLAHPWYGTLAGQGSFAQADALTEVLRSDAPRGAEDLQRALRGALSRYRIRAVVLDKPPPSWLAPQLACDFTLQPGPVAGRLLLRPPADLRGTPTLLYVRRPGTLTSRARSGTAPSRRACLHTPRRRRPVGTS